MQGICVFILYPANLLYLLISSSNFLGQGNGTPLQYSCLENPMDGGAWWATVHGVSRGRTESDTTERLHFHFSLYVLEKEMATHSSVLAWRIPGTGEPGGLPPVGSHRVGYDWSDLAAAAACRWHHPYGRKRRGSEELLDESERGEWKVGLKLNIKKTKIMASTAITSWQINGETVKTWLTLFFWAPKSLQMVIAAMKLKDACSWEAKLWTT